MWIQCAACSKYTLFPGTFGMSVKPKASRIMEARRLYLDGRDPTPVILSHKIHYGRFKCIWCRTRNSIHITWQATVEKEEKNG
jgi:hypothetical protein